VTTTTALEEATEHQPRARMALGAALESGPSHAYLFRGPRGAGKRAAARAFAAEILAAGAEDADDARRRALLDPSPHPDLVWLAPRGSRHLVEEVREQVIRAASRRPFEGERRVFVIEAAEAMRDESQNALLKTLEEPPEFAHLVLLSAEPGALLETVVSRCQPVEFAPLPVEVVEAVLAEGGLVGAEDERGGEPAGESGATPAVATTDEIAAAARLSAGDVGRARFLLDEAGRAIRVEAERLASAASGVAPRGPGAPEETGTGDPESSRGEAGTADVAEAATPWRSLLARAKAAGEEAEAAAREALEEQAAAGFKRSARDAADEAKRAGRRRRTEVLDLGLELTAAWFRDLAALAVGAEDVAYNRDRLEALRSRAAGFDPSAARRAAELVQDTRRRLDLNVSEELALEALLYRLGRAR
jgi:DNA polymerase-3 subunit delta'